MLEGAIPPFFGMCLPAMPLCDLLQAMHLQLGTAHGRIWGYHTTVNTRLERVGSVLLGCHEFISTVIYDTGIVLRFMPGALDLQRRQ